MAVAKRLTLKNPGFALQWHCGRVGQAGPIEAWCLATAIRISLLQVDSRTAGFLFFPATQQDDGTASWLLPHRTALHVQVDLLCLPKQHLQEHCRAVPETSRCWGWGISPGYQHGERGRTVCCCCVAGCTEEGEVETHTSVSSCTAFYHGVADFWE